MATLVKIRRPAGYIVPDDNGCIGNPERWVNRPPEVFPEICFKRIAPRRDRTLSDRRIGRGKSAGHPHVFTVFTVRNDYVHYFVFTENKVMDVVPQSRGGADKTVGIRGYLGVFVRCVTL